MRKTQHTQKTQSKKPGYPGWPGQETEWPILYRPQDHRLLASRFTRFLSPARGQRWYRTLPRGMV